MPLILVQYSKQTEEIFTQHISLSVTAWYGWDHFSNR